MNWLSPLVGDWMDRLRQYHKVGDTAALPGAKVVALICAHVHRVFTVHRKALKDNVEYCCALETRGGRSKCFGAGWYDVIGSRV